MTRRHAAALLAICCSAGAQAAPAARTPVPDPRPLMVAAIDSPSGQAHGVLTGQMADAMARKFRTREPLLIDVTTEKRYAQAGCSRLKVLFRQSGVWLSGSMAQSEQTIAFGIDYCRDGSPPHSRSQEK